MACSITDDDIDSLVDMRGGRGLLKSLNIPTKVANSIEEVRNRLRTYKRKQPEAKSGRPAIDAKVIKLNIYYYKDLQLTVTKINYYRLN